MPSLKDIYLITPWDLQNPIQAKISDSLHFQTNSKPFTYKPSSEPQCGNISMKFDKSKFEEIIKAFDVDNAIWQKQRMKAAELTKEIGSYLERKCEEYCEKNRISIGNWCKYAEQKNETNLWELRYKGELVCGAKVKCELTDVASKEANVSLELY